ncbi:MAG: MATE family efflux transporter [Eubacterium sp.]|nr:MATE family efflux transporter [Eubacterium sp.]
MQRKSFDTDHIFSLILKMALPSIAAQIVNLLYSIVDRIYIGHIAGIGVQALAGVGICSSIIILISACAQFTGSGAVPLFAIALGKKDRRQAEKILGNGVFFILLETVLILVPLFLCMDPLLRLIGASDVTFPYAHDYLFVYLMGTPFVLITVGLNPFINALGFPGISMLTILIGAALNIGLDPVFIFGFGMGVQGAAIATVLSQAVSALWILHFLRKDHGGLRLYREALIPEKKTLCSILALGISPFVMSSTESLVGFVLNHGLSVYGDIYVSALTVLQSFMQFANIPIVGFMQGAMPVVSYQYGAGNTDRLKKSFWAEFSIVVPFNFIVIFTMILFPGFYGRMFTSDAALLELVQKTAPYFLTGMTIFGMQRVCQSMFVSMNQPGISLFIALLRKVFLLVPLAVILPHFWGVTGIFTAESIADATAASICIILFAHRFPKILKKLQGYSKEPDTLSQNLP